PVRVEAHHAPERAVAVEAGAGLAAGWFVASQVERGGLCPADDVLVAADKDADARRGDRGAGGRDADEVACQGDPPRPFQRDGRRVAAETAEQSQAADFGPAPLARDGQALGVTEEVELEAELGVTPVAPRLDPG